MRFQKAITILLLTMALIFESFAMAPVQSYAESTSLDGVWVIPEIISGSRQPASGGMFAWITADYSYGGKSLPNDLKASDFTLQMKTADSEWTDVSGNNIVVVGGYEYYIDYFEAIIAARIPDNKDPFIKKWRVVYKPTQMESEIIVQAANLSEDDNIRVIEEGACKSYKVEQAPWSYEEYKKDNVPPVYLTYAKPDGQININDGGFVLNDDHQIMQPWSYSSLPMNNGVSYSLEMLKMVGTKLYLGDLEDDSDENDDGIAGLADYWEYSGVTPSSGKFPSAVDLYKKISSAAYMPDEDADEWLTANIENTSVFWVSGAGTEERVKQGVTDYILVVVSDWEAPETVQHAWGEPEWIWEGSDSEGYTSATLKFTCNNNNSHSKAIDASTSVSAEGINIIYTSKAKFEDQEYEDVKTVEAAGENELEKTKNAAKAFLDGIDTEKYSEADKDEVIRLIDEARNKVEASETTEAVTNALSDVQESVAAIKTNIDKAEEALAAVQTAKEKYDAAKKAADASKAAAAKAAGNPGQAAVDAARKAYEDSLAAKVAAEEYASAAAVYANSASTAYGSEDTRTLEANQSAWEAISEVSKAEKALTSAGKARAAAEQAKAEKEEDDKAAAEKASEKTAKEKAAKAAAKKAAAAKAKKVKTVTVNTKTVNAKTINAAVKKAGGNKKYVTRIILGKKVSKISKNSFKNYKKVTTITVKTKKLKKASVKNSLRGSKIKKVQIKVGSKKNNNKYVKKYKKIFTRKNAGKKVKVA